MEQFFIVSKSRGLSKQDCMALRAQLTDLGYGQAEAETDELFALRLYPVTEHVRALNTKVVLVVGPRGSGKSALFKAFFSENRDLADSIRRWMPGSSTLQADSDSAAWRAAYPAHTDFPDSQALAKRIHSEDDAKKIWHAMLVRLLRGFFTEDQRQNLTPLLEPMAVEVGDILHAYDTSRVSPTGALDELEGELQRNNRWIFSGYDELDTLGGSDWELMARMVRGLIAFWSDYSRRWERIRAKIFLRSDLFRRHAGMGTGDFAKLAANRAELKWSDAALLAMLVKRIANTSEELATYCQRSRLRFEEDDALGLIPQIKEPRDAWALLERLAGEFMGAERKKGFVRNWVLAHLRDGNGQISPRSLVRLLEQAAGKDVANQSLRPPRLIHPTALRQALDDVSDNHVTQGSSSEWPWLEGVRVRLQEDQLVPWGRAKITRLLGTDWNGSWGLSLADGIRPPADRPGDFVDYLIELGIFRRRADNRVDVPDLYLSGLNLRRKGGVSRRPKGARRSA